VNVHNIYKKLVLVGEKNNVYVKYITFQLIEILIYKSTI
jgi:hypothetical protein